MPQSICQQLKQEYEQLKALKVGFDLVYQKYINTKDLTEAKALKEQLEEQYNFLLEKLMIIHRRYYYPRELNNVEEKENYHKVETLKGHTGWVPTLQVLTDGRIVSGSVDGAIVIWDGIKKTTN